MSPENIALEIWREGITKSDFLWFFASRFRGIRSEHIYIYIYIYTARPCRSPGGISMMLLGLHICVIHSSKCIIQIYIYIHKYYIQTLVYKSRQATCSLQLINHSVDLVAVFSKLKCMHVHMHVQESYISIVFLDAESIYFKRNPCRKRTYTWRPLN